MINIENHLGTITISYNYLATLIGHTVTGCFGVVSMNPRGAKQNVLHFLKKDTNIDKGVFIKFNKDRFIIELHITVRFGTNVSAIVKSIMNKVRYTVEDETGLTVAKVNVFVDDMIS